MPTNIQYPCINQGDISSKVEGIRKYLYYLADQLNYYQNISEMQNSKRNQLSDNEKNVISKNSNFKPQKIYDGEIVNSGEEIICNIDIFRKNVLFRATLLYENIVNEWDSVKNNATIIGGYIQASTQKFVSDSISNNAILQLVVNPGDRIFVKSRVDIRFRLGFLNSLVTQTDTVDYYISDVDSQSTNSSGNSVWNDNVYEEYYVTTPENMNYFLLFFWSSKGGTVQMQDVYDTIEIYLFNEQAGESRIEEISVPCIKDGNKLDCVYPDHFISIKEEGSKLYFNVECIGEKQYISGIKKLYAIL